MDNDSQPEQGSWAASAVTLIINCDWERKPELVLYQGLDGGAEILPRVRKRCLCLVGVTSQGEPVESVSVRSFYFTFSQYGLHILSPEDRRIWARSHPHAL